MGMSLEFANVLQGLMDNRRLSPAAVSRASARAESTIRQLLNGRIAPQAEILQDIAPVLQIPLADLLVIAGLATEPAPDRPTPYRATAEIGELVAVASWLTPEQVNQLVDLACSLKAQNPEERD
jgi:transcriptional regulator with XRE-family HTH domain